MWLSYDCSNRGLHWLCFSVRHANYNVIPNAKNLMDVLVSFKANILARLWDYPI